MKAPTPSWPNVFEAHRRIILSATMFGCRGPVQNASGVIYLIVEHAVDLSADHKRVSGSEAAFPFVSGRGDEAKHSRSGLDSREPKVPLSKPRDMYEPNLHVDSLKVRARNFR
jgi:error-prone DNA polymerase